MAGEIVFDKGLGDWTGSMNWSSLGATLVGAHGGAGKGGGGIAGLGYFGNALADGLNMWTISLQSSAMQSAYRSQARLSAADARLQGRLSAEDYARQGDAAVRNMGIAQRAGADQTTLRYNALAREVSAQRVAAAGSGIDLSSRTAAKAEETSRLSAAWDVDRISRTTKNTTDALAEQYGTAMKNSAFASINSEYAARTADINGRLNARLAGISGRFGMARSGINMGMNIVKGAADIFSGGMVGAIGA